MLGFIEDGSLTNDADMSAVTSFSGEIFRHTVTYIGTQIRTEECFLP